MKVSYFPGCTLKTKAKELDKYARLCAEALGVTLEEIEDWQCCGGVFTTSADEIATKLSSVRALKSAKEKDQLLVSVCSACHNVLKQTNYAMANDITFRERANNYMAEDAPYEGDAKAIHYLELLRDEIGFDKVREAVKNPLEGKKVAAYYGCLLLRPGKVMQMDDVENPTIMEDLIRAMGAEPVVYPNRNECCGGYIALENADSAKKRSERVVDSANAHGADIILTACPLCKYNLEKNTGAKVYYLTELLAIALGIKEDNDAE